MNAEECSLISDFPESMTMSFNSDINEIVEEILTSRLSVVIDDVSKEVKECVEQLLNDIEKVTKKTERKLTRKRSLNPQDWEKNKRKRAHQSGDAYVSSRGKLIQAKEIKVKKDCNYSCKFKCCEKVNKATQNKIFLDFYKLDTNGKHSLLSIKHQSVHQLPTKNLVLLRLVGKRKATIITSFMARARIGYAKASICQP